MTNWKSGDSGYSAKDVMRMQREAEERVREMQERSRRALHQTPVYPDFVKPPSPSGPRLSTGSPSAPPPSRPAAPSPSRSAAPPPVQAPPAVPEPPKLGGLLGNLTGLLGGGGGGSGNGPISRVLEALHIDNDRLLLIALLFVLLNNNADKKLILALCYIML